MLSLNIPEKRTPTIDPINAHPTYHPLLQGVQLKQMCHLGVYCAGYDSQIITEQKAS